MMLAHTLWGQPDRNRRTILLLHGATGWSQSWWRIGPSLGSAGYCAIAVDLPGHGASPPAHGGFSADALRQEIVETLSRAIGTRGVDAVWGHSLGGVLALDLVLADSSFAQAIIVVDPPTSRPSRTEVDRLIETWTAHAVLARQEPATLVDLIHRQYPGWDHRDVEEGVMSMAVVNLDTLLAFLERSPPIDTHAALERLEVPALLVLAAENRGSMLTGAERRSVLARLPPHAEVLEMDAGHLIHRDAPDVYVRSVLAWLSLVARLPHRHLVSAPGTTGL